MRPARYRQSPFPSRKGGLSIKLTHVITIFCCLSYLTQGLSTSDHDKQQHDPVHGNHPRAVAAQESVSTTSKKTMSSTITIRGRSVALSQDLDSSKSNYIIIRTTGNPLNLQQKTELAELGVTIHEFVGNEDEQMYLARYPANSLAPINDLNFVDYVGLYSKEFVVPQALIARSKIRPRSTPTIDIDISLHHDIEEVSPSLANKIAQAAGIQPSNVDVQSGSNIVRLRLEDPDRLETLAALDEIRLLHSVGKPVFNIKVARQIINVDKPITTLRTLADGRKQLSSTVYRGKGQIIAVYDGGFDTGSTIDTHHAFKGRVKALFPSLKQGGDPRFGPTDDVGGHGTHVAGCALASGNHSTEGLLEGSAPEAELIAQNMLGGWGRARLLLVFRQAYENGARIHTNSWNHMPVEDDDGYMVGVDEVDRFIWQNQDMVILFCAGNHAIAGDGPWDKPEGIIREGSIFGESGAKNSITVGASENFRPNITAGEDQDLDYEWGGNLFGPKYTTDPLRHEHMSDSADDLTPFSSRGPTSEGRLKPDVVAPGSAVLSARSRHKPTDRLWDEYRRGYTPDIRWRFISGTSMSTPLVAGTCALIREALLANGYTDEQPDGTKNPTGSLVKALIINGAVPISGGKYFPPGALLKPNVHSGFGRVDFSNSAPKVNDSYSGYEIGAAYERDDAPVQAFEIPIPKTTEQLTFKVTMVYADRPGASLQHDLDLVVIIGNQERHGNQKSGEPMLAGSDEEFDRRNNVEQVVWHYISPVAGYESLQVVIKPYRFMATRVPFAFAWRFYPSD